MITLTSGPFDHADAFTDLFGASCGSIGEFTDIKKLEDGSFAIPVTMKNYSFSFRQLNGRLIGRVYPFDPSFFHTKVHPSGALLYTPFHSQLTFLQHLCIQLANIKDPPQLISTLPKYWMEDDGTLALFEENRWRSIKTLKWLKTHGYSCVPVCIREELMTLAQGELLPLCHLLLGCDDLLPMQGLGDVWLEVALLIHSSISVCRRCPVGEIGKAPAEARGYDISMRMTIPEIPWRGLRFNFAWSTMTASYYSTVGTRDRMVLQASCPLLYWRLFRNAFCL